MSDVSQAIERREGDSLSQILGTGDTRAMLATVERNVRDIIEVCRERGFVTHYINRNKKTGEVRESDFYGLPAWQLLSMTYGVTPHVQTLDPIDGGWKAYAIAKTRDGLPVGSDFGLCHRKEPGKEYKSDHDLAAMASARAKRNALRAAFGAALVLAGFDFPDPAAPATDEQVGLLHLLERQLGWSHEEGHSAAGVASYRDLSREAAHETIEAWSKLVDVSAPSRAGQRDPATPADNSSLDAVRDGATGLGADIPSATEQLGPPLPSEAEATAGGEDTAAHGPSSVERGGATAEAPPPAVTPQPASKELWKEAIAAGLTGGRAVKRARDRHRAKDPLFPNITGRASDLTAQQLEALLK